MDGYQNYLVNDKDELKRLYENKVIEYENVDDVYASKVDFWYYSKYTSFGEGFLDKLEWIGGALKSFGEGICGGVVDVVKGIGTLLWEIGEFAISGITCLVFTGVGCEPPEWASKNINETVDTVKLIMDDPIVILEGIGQGVSDAYEKEGICYCAGYAIGSYVGTKGITKATKVVTGKIKGIRANKELPKVEIENTLDELDEFEKFYDDIYDAQRELNPEYEEFLDDLTKAPDDGIVIESGRYSLPQGILQEQFSNASKLLRDRVGDISNDIVVQGSRAKGTAKPTSDIDIALRVSGDKFDSLINQYFKTPNPGSAKERTMLHAIETGKIQAGEAKLSGLRKELQEIFGMEVDISIIKQGGAFDNPSFISFE